MALRWDVSVSQLIIDAVAVLASIAALIVAWWSLSSSDTANTIAKQALDAQQAPAQLTMTVGDPTWRFDRAKGRPAILHVVTPVTVTNDGMLQGCVSDVIAHVKLPETGDERRMRALYVVDPERFLTVLRKPAPIYEAHKARFGPMMVLGKQQMSETVVFETPSIKDADLHSGRYAVTFTAAACSSPTKWDLTSTGTFLFTSEDLALLLKGQPLSQESEERREAVRAVSAK